MGQSDYPKIATLNDTMMDFNRHRGKPCLVKLKVKYKCEKDWVYHELWMIPGWESAYIWRDAYAWMRSEQMYTKYQMTEIEEAQFYEFKLV